MAGGDPVALSQFQNRAPFQPAGGGEIKIFQTGGCGKGRCPDVALDAVLAPPSAFMIHQQCQPFFKSQLGELRIGLLLGQRLAKGRQAQFQQLVIEGLQGHRFSPQL